MDRMKLLVVIFLFAHHQCTLVVEANNHHQKSQVVSQLKREVKRLREKDEALERRVQEMSEKDEALEEEVNHLRKDVEEQLVNVAKFLPSPCQHGKPFYENHFKCQCHQGWTGDKCQLDINECQGNNLCKNGGICINLQGNYTCDCSNTGYRGRQCEEFVNWCSDGVCQNDGVCTSQPEGYNCECISGYTGKNCQIIKGGMLANTTGPIPQMNNYSHPTAAQIPNTVPIPNAAPMPELTLDEQLRVTGRDVNRRFKVGETALHIAASKDFLEAAKWLINKGAELDAKNWYGRTPLHFAAYHDSLQVTIELISRGATVDARSDSGWTPLHVAAQGDNLHVARELINRGAEVDAKKNDGGTPLHLAAALDSLRVARELINKGANKNIKNNEGKKPIDLVGFHARFKLKASDLAKSSELEALLHVN